MRAKRSSGPAAKVSDDVQRDQQRDSAAEAEIVYGVVVPKAQAAEFRTKARMGALAEMRHEKPVVPLSVAPSSQPAWDLVATKYATNEKGPQLVDPLNLDMGEDLAPIQERKRIRVDRDIAEDRAKTVKAQVEEAKHSQELTRVTAAEPKENPVEQELARLLQIRQINELNPSNGAAKAPDPMIPLLMQQIQSQNQTMMSLLQMMMNNGNGKPNGSGVDPYAVANNLVATASALGEKFSNAASGIPSNQFAVDAKKLDVQRDLAHLAKDREHELKLLEAETSGRSVERIVGTLEKAGGAVIDAVTQGKGPLGEALAAKATQWGNAPLQPGQPAAPGQPGQKTPQEQLEALQRNKEEVARVEGLLRAQVEAEQAAAAADPMRQATANAFVRGPTLNPANPVPTNTQVVGPAMGTIFPGRK